MASNLEGGDLEKKVTNTSFTSSASKVSAKPRGLSRIFSRNKLRNTDVNPEVVEIMNSRACEDSESMFSSQSEKKSEKRKNQKKPSLTIETSGHNLMRVPKKILTASTTDDRFNPSLHASNHVFHRALAATDELLEHNEALPHVLSKAGIKKGLGLSSQNSNSSIKSPGLAAGFRFTDIDFMGWNEDGAFESTSKKDLRQKYMVSADLYFQKLHKAPPLDATKQEVHASQREETEIVIRAADLSTSDKVFAQLFELSLPIASPVEPDLVNLIRTNVSAEQLADFVRERILAPIAKLHRIAPIPDETNWSSMWSHSQTSQLAKMADSYNNSQDENSELAAKELLHKVSSFFFRFSQALATEYLSFESSSDAASGTKSNSQPERASVNQQFEDHLLNWQKICQAWSHFNLRVRFLFLHAFHQTQRFLDETLPASKLSDERSCIDLEQELLRSFRDVIVFPQLRERAHYLKLPVWVSGTTRTRQNLVGREKLFFNSQSYDMLSSLGGCLWLISSLPGADKSINDDMQSNIAHLTDFVDSFKLYTR